jgi:sugar-specific transcriptional regulator TrmB
VFDPEPVVAELGSRLELPEQEARLYVLMAQRSSVTLSELAAMLRLPLPEVQSMVRSLVQRGMVILKAADAEAYDAVHPRFALTNLYKALEARLSADLRARRVTVDRLALMLIPAYEAARHPRG